MTLYYFDIKDGGLPQRDRDGLDLASPGVAIDHSKDIARILRAQRSAPNERLEVVVVDETGMEIHREKVYPQSRA